MKTSRWRIRHPFLLGSVTSAAAVALVVTGLPAMALAAPASAPYPPPQGIYAPYTNCPLHNQVMHEATDFTLCIAALATNGTITIGNITTTVVAPVQVQFGAYTQPDATNYATVVAPPGGLAAQLKTGPDLLPESLTTALGCPSSNATVAALCAEAQSRGGKYNTVYALAQSAGAITNFALTSWTQPLKFQLINPLLGNTCYIGQDGLPTVLNPSVSINTASIIYDPDPAKHPDTFVITSNSTASDTTFSAPGVTGCGPGGVANIAVGEAINASAGLPSASGVNSLSLTGAFNIAACTAPSDTSLPQPQDAAAILLSAFKASSSATPAVSHPITASKIRQLLKLK